MGMEQPPTPSTPGTDRPSRIYLYWIPLGAGGSGFVRLNGRIYETLLAWTEHRERSSLYHTALEVHASGDRYVVETMWPIPDDDRRARGVAVEGPVFSGRLAFSRVFRYEVRCWRNGSLPDAHEAVGGPRLISTDQQSAERLLSLVPSVPGLVWGRDQLEVGDMWNSNSVVSWLLARSGLPIEAIRAPLGGRAPGWNAGLAAARQERGLGPHPEG